MREYEDLVGKRYGRLVVKELLTPPPRKMGIGVGFVNAIAVILIKQLQEI